MKDTPLRIPFYSFGSNIFRVVSAECTVFTICMTGNYMISDDVITSACNPVG